LGYLFPFKGRVPVRIPAFVFEHPVESLIAGVLLLALLFGPADRHAVEVSNSHGGSQVAVVAENS
jgi:hypothetical protein